MSQSPVTVLTASLHGKVALITGAGRGIGRGCAIELGRRGASVVVNYANSKESADEVVKLIEETGTGAKAISIQADVSKPSEIERLFQESKKHFGKIDIVMSNSGTESWDKTEEITEEKYDHVFNLNTRAQFFVGQAAWSTSRTTVVSSSCLPSLPVSSVSATTLCTTLPRWPSLA